MRGPACLAAGRLVDKRTAGLSKAERLRLESHLQGCSRCAADADAIEALTELADDLPKLSTFARSRALDNALREPRAVGSPELTLRSPRRGRLADVVAELPPKSGLP